jgi:hypothetical protein
MNRSLGALLGIATGILADRQLADAEIRFLHDWLDNNSAIATAWPGDVIHSKVKAVLADGVITDDERTHLVESLRQLIGGTLSELASSTHGYSTSSIRNTSYYILRRQFFFHTKHQLLHSPAPISALRETLYSHRVMYARAQLSGSEAR